MDAIIRKKQKILSANIELPLSKTIASRVLTLMFLNDIGNISIHNPSEDIQVFLNAIKQRPKLERYIYLNQSGTAYRFLLTSACFTEGTTIFTGKKSLFKRPIKPLIECLKNISADIELCEDKMIVKGKNLNPDKIIIDASLSGQFLSALLLVGNKLQIGTQIIVKDKIASYSFVETTIKLLRKFGVHWIKKHNTFILTQNKLNIPELYIERDWSSASYFMLLSLISGTKIYFPELMLNSIQPDKNIVDYLQVLGLKIIEYSGGVEVFPSTNTIFPFTFDMELIPDMILGFAFISLYTKGICKIRGTRTLPHKETNRIQALKNELPKTGAKIIIEPNEVIIDARGLHTNIYTAFTTYEDHRIAMSESLLVELFPQVYIKDIDVVRKTFPDYWKELQKLGYEVEAR